MCCSPVDSTCYTFYLSRCAIWKKILKTGFVADHYLSFFYFFSFIFDSIRKLIDRLTSWCDHRHHYWCHYSKFMILYFWEYTDRRSWKPRRKFDLHNPRLLKHAIWSSRTSHKWIVIMMWRRDICRRSNFSRFLQVFQIPADFCGLPGCFERLTCCRARIMNRIFSESMYHGLTTSLESLYDGFVLF